METRSSTSKSAVAAVPVVMEDSKAKLALDSLKHEDESSNIKSPLAKETDGVEWKPDDRLVLIDQIQLVLPPDDNVKYSTMADKLCWSKVKVGNYSPEECKEEWLRISTKLRRFRTMKELLVDAKTWMKHPWNAFGKKVTKHPDMPKKPLTPYFRFFMAKRQKYAAKHPKMGVTDLTKELSKKYADLSEKKKKKFLDEYNKEMEEWKAAMVEFRKHHPEVFEDDDKTGGTSTSSSVRHPFHVAPPKSTTAMQLYINEKYLDEKDPNVSRKQLYEKFKSQWIAFGENKKLKYIKLAIEAKEKYDMAVEKYRLEHPEYQPRSVKSFLSKAEQKIKDRYDGKPEKPPVNGYSLFTVETLPLLTDMPNIERLGEVSRRWKKLSEDKREAYNLKADERNQEYRIKYEKYVQGLPEEERRKLEEEENDKKKKQPPNSNASPQNSVAVERPQKPVAAVFLFINDKKEDYRKKFPQMDDNELQRLLVKEYNCLNEKDKVKYKKLEEQEKKKIAQETVPPPAASNKKVKRAKFPGEPPKPPHSGYQLFSKELLTQLKDVKANERLQEIGKRWLGMSDDEKRQHNKRKDLMWTQYRKDLEKFKKGLSPKDRKKYEELNKPAKKKPKAKKVEVEAQNESSSAEEDGEENGDASSATTAADSSEEEEDGDEDADETSSSDSESGDDAEGSGSGEDEKEVAPKQVNENTNTQTQGKSGLLTTKDVYDDSSNDDSSDESDSDESSSESA